MFLYDLFCKSMDYSGISHPCPYIDEDEDDDTKESANIEITQKRSSDYECKDGERAYGEIRHYSPDGELMAVESVCGYDSDFEFTQAFLILFKKFYMRLIERKLDNLIYPENQTPTKKDEWKPKNNSNGYFTF